MNEYPLNRPPKICIRFRDRNWENKLFFMFYRMIRVLHVSIWFYFFPMIALIANYLI